MWAKSKIKATKFIKKAISLTLSALTVLSAAPNIVFAANSSKEVVGRYYEFDGKNDYEYSKAESYTLTSEADTYGKFTINGSVIDGTEKEGISVYEVEEGALNFTYSYNDTLINADIDSWHLHEDGVNKVDGIDIGANVRKGAILVYTSIDRKNWTNAITLTNIFSETPTSSSPIYTTKDVELINGCYYKVIIAYEAAIRTEDSNILFIETDKYDYKRHAEVYEFYAFTDSGEKEIIDYSQTYNIGSKVRTKDFDGYYEAGTIEKNDPHYGWDLGNFFVSGYTDKRVDDDGSVVFLKNLGDKVTLWFNLLQNIDSLNGNDNISITEDSEGFDKYFETARMDFGKGVLIVRYTDYNNNKTEPQIYTNYLEANTSFGADTKVQLFEEGDYEIALDYEVTKDDLIDAEGHYRIFFKFSVRNGNCMVYPFDVATGNELTNSSMTESGFRLDLAKSRYLQVNVKREVMKDSADGLVEDTRFNGPAKDGAEYTDEGIYTITVSNLYTNQSTVKKIYVGTNNIMRAYVTTGLSITEINNLVAKGAVINEDGTIQNADEVIAPAETEAISESTTETESAEETTAVTTQAESPVENNDQLPPFIIPVVIVIVAAVIAVVILVVVKNNKKKSIKSTDSDSNIDSNNEGGDTK